MPSATQTQPSTHSNKKRRHGETIGNTPVALYVWLAKMPFAGPRCSCLHLVSTTVPPPPRSPPPPYDQHYDCRPLFHDGLDRGLGLTRKLSDLPATKRARKGSCDGGVLPSGSKPFSVPIMHCPAPPAPPQAQPVLAHPDTPRVGAAALLKPCHVCHRRPSTKSDVDSYADCQGCGQRTCYVCVRSCPGWLPAPLPVADDLAEDTQDLSASFTMRDVDDEGSAPQDEQSWRGSGHQAVVCSRCCVERGSEGDVICLACLAGTGGP